MVWDSIEHIVLVFSLLTGLLQLTIRYGREANGLKFFRWLYEIYISISQFIYRLFQTHLRSVNPLKDFNRLIHISVDEDEIKSETFYLSEIKKGLFFRVFESTVTSAKKEYQMSVKGTSTNIFQIEFSNDQDRFIGFMNVDEICESRKGQKLLFCDMMTESQSTARSLLIFSDQTHSYISELLEICPNLVLHSLGNVLIENKKEIINHTMV